MDVIRAGSARPQTNLRRGQTAAASTVWRQSVYPAEPGYASIAAKLQTVPAIAVPAIIDGTYEHRVFPVGHNVPRGAPQTGMDVDRF